jgi:hypothetical protein
VRYYAIKLGGSVPAAFKAMPGAAISGAQWCSVINGKNDPGALNIELDVTVSPSSGDGASNGFVRVWGIPLEMISQAAKLSGCTIDVYGGYTDGLPLATAQTPHQGMIFSGSIQFAFGNWQMSDMTLDMTIIPTVPKEGGKPSNIVHNMPANTPLSQAMQNTLKTAFPGKQIIMKISDKLKLGYQDAGFYQNLAQYATYARNLSLNIMNGSGSQKTSETSNSSKSNYKGISIVPFGQKIFVHDFSQADAGTTLKYIDLVGQPTWIGVETISIKTVMRSDILPGATITLPPTLVTTTAASAIAGTNNAETGINTPGATSGLTFQGAFFVNSERHVGNFRQPGGDSWVTIFNCLTQSKQDADNKDKGGSNGTAANQQKAAEPDPNNGSWANGNSSFGPGGNFNDTSTFVPSATQLSPESSQFVPNPALGGRH